MTTRYIMPLLHSIIRKKKTHGTGSKPAPESYGNVILPNMVTNPLFEGPTAEDGYGVQMK